MRDKTDEAYLTIAAVRERYSVSDATIDRWVRSKHFPAAIKVGGPHARRRWRLSDLVAWEKARIKEAAA